jgi:hypothetical protein
MKRVRRQQRQNYSDWNPAVKLQMNSAFPGMPKELEFAEFWKCGDMYMESWKHVHGVMETWKHRGTDLKTWKHRDMGTWKHGDMETWRHGDMETWRHGDMEMWRRRNMETWRRLNVYLPAGVYIYEIFCPSLGGGGKIRKGEEKKGEKIGEKM